MRTTWVGLAMVGAALLGACGGDSHGHRLEQIRERGRLIVAHEAAFEPFEYMDPTSGKLVGFDVDLVGELAKDLGVQVEFRNMAFDVLGADLTTGRSDLIVSGLTANEERRRTYAMSEPYFHTVTALLVSKAKAPGLASVKDLDRPGRRVVVQSGTTGIAAAEAACPRAEIVQLKTENDCVLEVAQGRADAFLMDLASIRKDHERNPDTTFLVETPITSEPYGIAAHKDEPALVAWVNAELAKMRTDGRLAALLAKYKPAGTLDPP